MMAENSHPKFFDRELSWLAFNHRVLQEAADKDVPLFERIKFLAIYSSNLDEFFRVRVASLRSLLELKKKTIKKLDFAPRKLLKKIHATVDYQQEELGRIFRKEIIPELKKNNIIFTHCQHLSKQQTKFIDQYFEDHLKDKISPVNLKPNKDAPFLQNKGLYFAIRLRAENEKKKFVHALLPIPTGELPRFIELPQHDGNYYVTMLDDILFAHLADFFPDGKIDCAFQIKLTRDAEMYIDDEFSGNLIEKIRKGIARRKQGVPSRFLYDKHMPKSFLNFLCDKLNLSEDDLVPGGNFHNFNDLFSFPNPLKPKFENIHFEPVEHAALNTVPFPYSTIYKNDILLHYPYHSYRPVVEFIKTTAHDEQTKAIWISLYRLADPSRIIDALVTAARAGKRVTVFVELKARFDEESNFKWAETMERAGIKVLYSFPGLKVHAKICMIERIGGDLAYLATGNFNEKTAGIYSDIGIFTANAKMIGDLKKVFAFLSKNVQPGSFDHLLVAPFNLRSALNTLIDQEIKNASSGLPAEIFLKMNSLQDPKMIRRLYKASQAGVKIRLIIRGICCLVPGVPGLSDNIEAISIIDRFLEHTRVFMFENNGNKLVFSGSADWMKRNLSRRIEVVFPLLDKQIAKQVEEMMEIQWRDNCKARVIDADQSNKFVSSGNVKNQSQETLYLMFGGSIHRV